MSLNKVEVGRDPGKARPLVASVGTDIGPTPKPVGPDKSKNGVGKFEGVSPAPVHGNANSPTGTKHGGHAVGDGASPPFKAQAPSRGIVDVAAKGWAVAGRSPQRGPGKKTPPTTVDKGMD
jgi:hypothetical protein